MAGMKYKDIAAKYGVSLDTVKSWKKRHKWDRKGVHTKLKKGCTQKSPGKSDRKEPIVDEVVEVIENDEITEKQRLFCIYFIRCFNATKAYQKAYGCGYAEAAASGSRLLKNVRVKEMIQQLKQEKLNREFLTEDDIFQKYMDIAFADIGDYIQFGREKVPVWKQVDGKYVPVVDPNTGQQKVNVFNVVRISESSNVDTSVISEISEGQSGVKIKLADRMRALEWLSEHMDMANSGQKEEYERKKGNVEAIVSQLRNIEDDEASE